MNGKRFFDSPHSARQGRQVFFIINLVKLHPVCGLVDPRREESFPYLIYDQSGKTIEAANAPDRMISRTKAEVSNSPEGMLR
jgi:hypothetical protein